MEVNIPLCQRMQMGFRNKRIYVIAFSNCAVSRKTYVNFLSSHVKQIRIIMMLWLATAWNYILSHVEKWLEMLDGIKGFNVQSEKNLRWLKENSLLRGMS